MESVVLPNTGTLSSSCGGRTSLLPTTPAEVLPSLSVGWEEKWNAEWLGFLFSFPFSPLPGRKLLYTQQHNASSVVLRHHHPSRVTVGNFRFPNPWKLKRGQKYRLCFPLKKWRKSSLSIRTISRLNMKNKKNKSFQKGQCALKPNALQKVVFIAIICAP